jgi:hypothetical protein
MDDIDIWRAAQLLIKQRDDPELFAAGRVDDEPLAAAWRLGNIHKAFNPEHGGSLGLPGIARSECKP